MSTQVQLPRSSAMVRSLLSNKLTIAVGAHPAEKLPMPPTAGAWTSLDVPATLAAGANRIVIEGHEEEWNSVLLDKIEVEPRDALKAP